MKICPAIHQQLTILTLQ